MNGKKVELRAIQKADLPKFVEWINDTKVNKFLLHYRPMTLEEELLWYDKKIVEKNDVYFSIVAKKEKKLIGSTNLHKIDTKNRCAEIGMMIGDKYYWGKGYGTDALTLLVDYGFNTLNLNRIELTYIEFNERAKNCYTNVGFKEEGIKRKAQFIDGKYWDVVMMGLLRSEWKS